MINKKHIVFLEIFAGIILIYFLGAFTAAWLFEIFNGEDSELSRFVLQKGPGKLMRRCCMFWALPLIPFLFREIGWKGWKDSGWVDDSNTWTWKRARKNFLIGLAFGLTSMGSVLALHWWMGVRLPAAGLSVPVVILKAIKITFLDAVFVSLLEDTFLLGILFRKLSKFWPAGRVALGLSLTFALMHFMTPHYAVYGQGTLWQTTLASLKSMFIVLAEKPYVHLRVLNLCLMGLVLALTVAKTRTIWLSVGMHAGWVWVRQMNGYVFDINLDKAWMPWWGQRIDATDSLICSAILTGIGLYFIIPRRRVEDSI